MRPLIGGKSLWIIVENAPVRLWKEPVFRRYRGSAGCGYPVEMTDRQNEQAGRLLRPASCAENVAYFSEVLMLSKFVLSCLPTP